MSFLFGKRQTPEEMLRNNQRALNKAMRDLDRERTHLENQEKKVIADIKKMAKMGQMDAVKVMAKDLVRTRNAVKKFMLMKANIQAVSLKITTLKSNHAMGQAMKQVTKAMATMNKKMNLPEIQKIMMEFEKQSEIMDMKEEMMDDAIDNALGDDDDEIEGDRIVNQVLDELGIELSNELTGVNPSDQTLASGSKNKTPVPAGPVSDADADLEARLEALRRQ
ncbi:Charged multivesicular body 2a [Brachionus plicatilis]|uniref:Charged multivesicular body 2a n=1 Tax=Brachionus plicatilis TaxID=10195 RepID=A0A3M7QK05_BRAPC|nr:Charged multivesicular body 2a [Brachionus plicatilis]